MKALALVDAPDHVCCRYRIKAFEPALARVGWNLTCQTIAVGAIERVIQLARAGAYDAVVLQRKLLPRWQLAILRRNARHLVFDFDDAVLYRDSFDRRGPESARRSRRFAATVRTVDVVLAGNDFLADCALRAGAKPDQVRVIPTCIELKNYPFPAVRQNTGLQLVWIGSSSTLQGLEQHRALWERLALVFPGLTLRVICDRFPDLGMMPVVAVPWSQATETSDLAAGDVGISWVPDDLWSRGKCGLKVLQYQAAGLPVIANPVGVHTEMVIPGETGELASSSEEWEVAVRKLIVNQALRQKMGRSGRAAVQAGYSIPVWETAFLAALNAASSSESTSQNLRPRRESRLLVRAAPGPIGAEG